VNRIELLEFITDFRIGGTERQMVNLGKALAGGRFNLHLACFRRSGQFLHEIESEATPLTEYDINSLYNLNTFRQQLRFAGYARRNGIHIVHTYGFYPNVFAIPAARLAGVPAIVASIRDMGELWTPRQRRVQKFVCRFAHRILVNAHAIKLRLIEEGYRGEQISVISNGLDLSRFAEIRRNNGLRQTLGLPPHGPLIGVVGRIHPMKGIENFLEAAQSVAGRFPDARFLIVGDGATDCGKKVLPDCTYKEELERLAARLGLGQRVVFTGFRLDTPDLLAELAVSVLPSLSEGLSNVLLESMAAGVPVVATRVGGNPEAVEENVTGLLVPPRDSAALALAICQLLEDPKLSARFGQAGKERVARYFSLEHMVQETERLYQELVCQAGLPELSDLQIAPRGLFRGGGSVRPRVMPGPPAKQRTLERPL
jgi:glycosyltransferase involved in cell wall biosynthesis